MPSECRGCQWQNVVGCSVRDRLVSIGVTPPCVVPTGDEHEQMDELRAELESLKADAKLCSAVKACDADYQIWALRRPYSPNKDRPWYAHTRNRMIAKHRTLQDLLLALEGLKKASVGDGDPAEALRSIQEVGDEEA